MIKKQKYINNSNSLFSRLSILLNFISKFVFISPKNSEKFSKYFENVLLLIFDSNIICSLSCSIISLLIL